MKKQFFAGAALCALIVPGAAFAQSTGTVDFEQSEIIVTGARLSDGVMGVAVPDSSKSKVVLTDAFIQRQAPGASINDVINQIPGVSFQNNDPFGSSGGSLNIRGFDATRISQTFDGVPLNDSGNYAIYGNQQLDPELIDQVSVNLGSGDVDAPTAGATGSTVNYRTRLPGKNFGAKLVGSMGDSGFFRVFGLVDTGEFTPWGTRAFFAASHAENFQSWNRYSKIDKAQYNARIYQPLGDNGDFISLAGHYNQNRNNFQGSVPLRTDLVQRIVSGTSPNQVITTIPRNVGINGTDRYPLNNDEAFYTVPALHDQRPRHHGYWPMPRTPAVRSSTSASIRRTPVTFVGSSRFTLSDGLVLTVDPSFPICKGQWRRHSRCAGRSARSQSVGRARQQSRSARATPRLRDQQLPVGLLGRHSLFRPRPERRRRSARYRASARAEPDRHLSHQRHHVAALGYQREQHRPTGLYL